ncbi:hypothetical protein [Paenibacillus herberti]|nr:hypothetical protein [Paenibacillus herberti]
MKEQEEKDKAVREGGKEEAGKEVPAEIVEQQDDPETEGGKASGQAGLGR